jgi:hypothetical protein
MQSMNAYWHELIANPMVQSGIAPFVAALLGGWLLKRLGWFWAGLCITLGFALSVYLSVGFEFEPLTGTRKIILLGLGAAGMGLLLDLYPYDRRVISWLLFAAGGAAGLWVIWPALMRMEGAQLLLFAVGTVLYVGWMTAAVEHSRDEPVRLASIAVAVGLGVGFSALLGASALLGQLGIAVGASAGAFWLLAVADGKARAGSIMALPVGVLSGLLGIAALMFAKLPWYSLPVLALVPLLGRMPMPAKTPAWLEGMLTIIFAGAPAAAAVYLTWKYAGGIPL